MSSTEWLLMEHLHLSSHLGEGYNGDDDGDHDDGIAHKETIESTVSSLVHPLSLIGLLSDIEEDKI